METTANTHTLAPMASACGVTLCRAVFKIARALAVNKPLAPPKKEYPKARGRTADAQTSKSQASSDARNKDKRKFNGKDKNKPSARTGDVDFDDAENDMPEQEDTQEWTEEPDELEVYFADGQTSESEEDFGCMPDWSASECTDYKQCAFAPVACASSDSSPASSWHMGTAWSLLFI